MKNLGVILAIVSLIYSCQNPAYESDQTKIQKPSKLSSSGFYTLDILDYNYKGDVKIVKLDGREHKLEYMRGGWSEKHPGYGIYFYTFRDPKYFVEALNNFFKVKPSIKEEQYSYPYPDIEDWKYYEWHQKTNNEFHTLHVRKYFDGSESYIPYYEFLFEPFLKSGKPLIGNKGDEFGVKTVNFIQKIIDSAYKDKPMLDYDKSKLGGTFDYQTEPINRKEIEKYINFKNIPTFYQVFFEFNIDTNGKISRYRNFYDVDNSSETKIMDSIIASKFQYPILSFNRTKIPYETLIKFEYNPLKSKKAFALEVMDSLENKGAHFYRDFYTIDFASGNGKNFCFSKIGMDSIFIWEKNKDDWKLVFDFELDFGDRMDQYYYTGIATDDFNLDGFPDLIISYGPPFDGSGSLYHALYLFDPDKGKYVSIPQFSEYDFNNIIPVADEKCLYVFCSGGNYGTAKKYKYIWKGLTPILQEYATGMVSVDEKGENYVTEFYRSVNGKLNKIWEKEEKFEGWEETHFYNLIFPDSIITW